MTRLFFKLHPIFYLLFGLVFLFFVGLFISCDLSKSGLVTSLGSSSDDSDDNDDDDDDDDRNSDRICDERSSCQKRCDRMFRHGKALSQCYDLKLSAVDSYEEVFDKLSGNNVDKRRLNNIDADDLGEFLELSIGGWKDLIDGRRGGNRNDSVREEYSPQESKQVLLWVAENDDVADNIDDQDEEGEILYELFIRHGNVKNNLPGLRFVTVNNGSSDTNIIWTNSQLKFAKGSTEVSISVDGISKVLNFVVSYIGLNRSGLVSSGSNNFSFDGDSFVEYADEENNDSAVKLAHKTAVEFCISATGEDSENDDKVKQCLLALYCSLKTNVSTGTVALLSSRGGSVTRDSVPESFDNFLQNSPFNLDDRGAEMCSYDTLTNSDRFDNYF